MDIYRGDTFKFDFTATKNGEPFNFRNGDSVKVGIKNKLTNPKYELFKKILVEEETDTIAVNFTHNDMMNVCEGEKILEIELTDTEGNVSTLYQDKINVMGDVINE